MAIDVIFEARFLRALQHGITRQLPTEFRRAHRQDILQFDADGRRLQIGPTVPGAPESAETRIFFGTVTDAVATHRVSKHLGDQGLVHPLVKIRVAGEKSDRARTRVLKPALTHRWQLLNDRVDDRALDFV